MKIPLFQYSFFLFVGGSSVALPARLLIFKYSPKTVSQGEGRGQFFLKFALSSRSVDPHLDYVSHQIYFTKDRTKMIY